MRVPLLCVHSGAELEGHTSHMSEKPTPELSGNEKVGFLSYISSASQCFQNV